MLPESIEATHSYHMEINPHHLGQYVDSEESKVEEPEPPVPQEERTVVQA